MNNFEINYRQLLVLTAIILNTACQVHDDTRPQSIEVISHENTDTSFENAENDELLDDPDDSELQTQGLLTWEPDGTRNREVTPSCRLDAVKKALRGPFANFNERFLALQNLKQRCEDDWGRHNGLGGWPAALSIVLARYNVAENSKIQEVIFNLSDGTKIKGLLALKPTSQPLPLVIARCGVFCDTSDRGPRILLMHLFDESPFHVLALPSTTGTDFVTDNKMFAIGGYYEGVQQIKIAEYLKSEKSNLAERFTEVHAAGISLGSNAAVMSSVIAHYNNEKSPFKSSVAICPVVNLEPTLDELFDNLLQGWLMSRGAWATLKKLYELQGRPVGNKPSVREFYNLIRDESQPYMQTAFSNPHIRWNPFKNFDFSAADQLWNTTQMSDFASDIQIPTLAIGSKDDPVVVQKVNTIPLAEQVNFDANTSVKSLVFESGKHCAIQTSYGWPAYSEIIRSFLISQSPSLKARQVQVDIPSNLIPSSIKNLKSEEMHFSQTFEADHKDQEFKIKFEIWSPKRDSSCSTRTPYNATSACFRTATIKLPFSIFAVDPLFWNPTSKVEAQATNRWANTNVVIYSNEGTPLYESTQTPSQLVWDIYD